MGEVISEESLARVVRERQRHGEQAVFTNGCFDLLHLGHVRYLQRARELGDFLIVAINSDESTRQLKGPERPLVPEKERAEVLAALANVDYVTIFADNTAGRLLERLRPSLYVKGGDYAGCDYAEDLLLTGESLKRLLAGDASEYPQLAHIGASLPELPVVAQYGGRLALLAYLPEHSTTVLIDRIVSRYADSLAETQKAEQRGTPD
ncbi:MAG: ADP-heptose synthase [Chloroflexi bacterium]|nr:MAG: ADP-heptose synthase [Chloroflexota bacterium]